MTSPRILAAIAVPFVILCGGCRDSPDRVTGDAIAAMTELISVLEQIDTEEDARAARVELRRIASEMESIRDRRASLRPLDSETQARLHRWYRAELDALLPRLLGTQINLALRPELNRIVQPQLGRIKACEVTFE